MTEFDAFVAQHAGDLLRTVYLIVRDEHEAEDLVQECLLEVARRWPRVQAMDRPLAYTRRILINLAADGSRTRARRRSELVEQVSLPSDETIDPTAARDERAELRAALAELPVRQRAVLVLRYFNDLTEAQTAEILGCSRGTIKSSASRGLAHLRDVLEPTSVRSGSSEA